MLRAQQPAPAAAPHRHATGCGRQVVTWDYWSEELRDGIWRITGICGRQPAVHTVVEHCITCERLRTTDWCPDCVEAYLDEQHQQLCTGDTDLLWCLGCQHFTLEWRVIECRP